MRQRLVARGPQALQHATTGRVELQQFVAGHRPQLAERIHLHVDDRSVEDEWRRSRSASRLQANRVVAVDLVAQRAGACQDSAIGHLDQRLGADLGSTHAINVGETAQCEGSQDAVEVAARVARDLSRQLSGGSREEIVGRIAAVLRSGRGGRSRCDGGVGTESRDDILPRAIVGQCGVGEDLGLRVAGMVGGDGDELVVPPRLADEHGLFRPGRQLALPETKAAAVLGDVEADRAHPGKLVAALPAQIEAGGPGSVGSSGRGDGQLRSRCLGVEPDGVRLAVDRRQGVDQQARGGAQVAAGRGAVGGANGVGDEAFLRHAGGSGGVRSRQQAAVAVADDLTGGGVDGLQEPGGDAAAGIDAGTDTQDESRAAAEVEVALERGPVVRQMDREVADAQVAKTERSGIEVRVDLADDAQLTRRRNDGIGEREAVGQGKACSDMQAAIVAALRLWTFDTQQGGLAGGLVDRRRQVASEVERLRRDRPELLVENADVTQVFEFGLAADEDAEVEEVGFVRGVQVETIAVGKLRNGHVDAAVAILPRLEVADRRLAGAGVAEMAGGVAVPLLHLGEEGGEIGLRPVAVTAPAEQNAGGEGRVEAQHLRLRADRCRLVDRSQDSGSLECSEPSRLPLVRIGSDHRQARGCVGVGKDRRAQPLRVRPLLGDELVAAECRGAGDEVETERHGQRFESREMFAVDP